MRTVAVAAALVVASAAQAGSTTVTFDEVYTSSVSTWNGMSNPKATSSDGLYVLESIWLNTSGHTHITTATSGNKYEGNHNQSGASANLAQLQGFRITKADGGAFTLSSMGLHGRVSVGFIADKTTGAGTYYAYSGSSGTAAAPGRVGFGTQFVNVTEVFILDPYGADATWTAGGTNSWDDFRLATNDADGDGYTSSAFGGDDCNDAVGAINPGTTESCNGIDDDCSGVADDGLTVYTYYLDSDKDGYGATAPTTSTCQSSAPSGYSSVNTDCDDSSASIRPGATEICDYVDQNCDGTKDEGVTTTYYADTDGDTYGDPDVSIEDCSLPTGYSLNLLDCDDSASTTHPSAPETCNLVDDDCDSTIDEGVKTTFYADDDGDTYGDPGSTEAACTASSGYVANNTDCDDTRGTVHPGATETCNLLDDDCDVTVDEGVETTFYADTDGDTYGDTTSTDDACTAPTGYVANDEDCDDTAATVYPGATETCNLVDDDCNLLVDDGAESTFYADFDGDSYGDPTITEEACDAPTDYVADSTDCDDDDATAYPGATETPYDGIDQDCSGADLTDVDGDGYDSEVVTDGDDCNDADDTIHPGATETIDGADEDCNGLVDDGTDAYDDDGDGYSEDGGDCDDADDTVGPDAVEACDGADQDCDEIIDEDTECYDDDGDGYDESQGDCDDANVDRSPGVAEVLENGVDDDCDGIVDEGGINDPDEDGHSEAGGDCDPEDGTVYPGAPELEDGKDNDCDEIIDEGTDAYDDDGDGYTENEGDCNDADVTINPDASETADGMDEDCDGVVDNGTAAHDDDGDGTTEDGGDCDDADATVHPGAEELANGQDDDCDGEVDEGLDDLDGDGFGTADGDCDDADDLVYPSAYETCDGIDNDCNDAVDDNSVCEADAEKGGCGCAIGGSGTIPSLLPLLGLALLRRRRG